MSARSVQIVPLRCRIRAELPWPAAFPITPIPPKLTQTSAQLEAVARAMREIP